MVKRIVRSRWFIPGILVLIILILLIALLYPRGGGGQPNMTTSPTPTTTNATLGAWIYPDTPGSAACSAPKEYSDGRIVDTLKPQYYTLQDTGVLTQITTATQCNGYSPENVADIKAHSRQQFVTISGGMSGIINLANTASKAGDFTNALLSFLQTTGFTGVELDVEGYAAWSHAQYAAYLTVVTNLGNALHGVGKQLMLDGPIIMNAKYQSYYPWKWEDFEKLPVDHLVSMCYDLQNDNGVGTPIVSLQNITDCCTWMKARISDSGRITIGVPSYSYSGQPGKYVVTKGTYQDAVNYPEHEKAVRDPASGEMMWTASTGIFYDYSDATTMNMRLQAVLSQGISSVSVWALGGLNPWPSASTTQPTTHTPPPQTAVEVVELLASAYPGFDGWYRKFFDSEGNYTG